jgi:hypothetical protein
MKIRACSTFPYLIKMINDSYVIENEFRLIAKKLIKKKYTDSTKSLCYKYLDKQIKCNEKISEIETRLINKKYFDKK